jgi:nucleoside-diphosphate kinase
MDDRRQRTFVLIKPDAVQRKLVARILGRIEAKGLELIACRLLRMDEPTARKLYAVHEGKDFYEPLVAFTRSGPLLATLWQGREAIAVVRRLIGATYGPEAAPGTVRGDFGLSRRHNLVHASDSPQAVEHEAGLVFAPGDVVEQDPALNPWVYELD